MLHIAYGLYFKYITRSESQTSNSIIIIWYSTQYRYHKNTTWEEPIIATHPIWPLQIPDQILLQQTLVPLLLTFRTGSKTTCHILLFPHGHPPSPPSCVPFQSASLQTTSNSVAFEAPLINIERQQRWHRRSGSDGRSKENSDTRIKRPRVCQQRISRG